MMEKSDHLSRGMVRLANAQWLEVASCSTQEQSGQCSVRISSVCSDLYR
jgi:hypothetical protein